MGRFDTAMYRQNPLRSVADYENEYLEGDVRRQAIKANQFKMDEYLRGVSDDNALRGVVSGFGADRSTNQQALLRAGRLKEAEAYAKQGADIGKSEADTRKTDLETRSKTINIVGSASKFVMDNPTKENAVAAIGGLTRDGVLSPQDAQSTLSQLGNDPAQIRSMAELLFRKALAAKDQLAKSVTVDADGTTDFYKVDPVNQQPIPVGSSPKSQSPDSIASDNRTAALIASNEKIAGMPARSSVVPVGSDLSPKDKQKREEAYPKASSAVKAFDLSSKELETDLKKLRDHVGLASITGIAAGRIPGLTADGRAAHALYNKIAARGGFSEMSDLKSAGGTLGQVSNAEGQFLREAFSAIDRRQDAGDVQKAINDAIAKVQNARKRIRDEYDLTYEYRGDAADKKGGKTIKRTGTSNGRKVIEYSDGSIEYAD